MYILCLPCGKFIKYVYTYVSVKSLTFLIKKLDLFEATLSTQASQPRPIYTPTSKICKLFSLMLFLRIFYKASLMLFLNKST